MKYYAVLAEVYNWKWHSAEGVQDGDAIRHLIIYRLTVKLHMKTMIND